MNLPFHNATLTENPNQAKKGGILFLLFNRTLFIDALGHVSTAENVVFSNRNCCCVHGLFLLYSFHLMSYICIYFLINSQNALEFLT